MGGIGHLGPLQNAHGIGLCFFSHSSITPIAVSSTHLVLLRQEAARLLACLVDGLTFNDAVRAGEVDVLKHAHLAVRAAHMVPDAPQLAGLGIGRCV